MISPSYRIATPEDSEFAYQVKKAAFREYVEQVWGWDEAEQRALHEGRFESQSFQIIQVGATDVGILCCDDKGDHLKLNQLFILPQFQGQGIGGAVIQDLLGKGAPVRLGVMKVNMRAIRFYERLGFRAVTESGTHLQMVANQVKS